jgi:sugar/nucleoside kinase (ribokinase family)
LCKRNGTPLLFEPTSVPKAVRVINAGLLSSIEVITPNRDEAAAMVDAVSADHKAGLDLTKVNDQCRALIRAGVKVVILKLGSQGGLIAEAAGNDGDDVKFTPFAPVKPEKIINVVGAGDSLVSGTIWGSVVKGLPFSEAIKFGVRAARLSLESQESISLKLSAKAVEEMTS